MQMLDLRQPRTKQQGHNVFQVSSRAFCQGCNLNSTLNRAEPFESQIAGRQLSVLEPTGVKWEGDKDVGNGCKDLTCSATGQAIPASGPS